MNKNKKIILIISILLVSIVLIVGVSSAVMNYNRIGSNGQVVLGDIWMSYEESTALTIEDAIPGSDYSNYFEFTISGKNTYTKKDIYYDFVLVRGDLPSGASEDNRIPDKYLKFKLVSVDSNNQETVIFTDETYERLENQRIYVETIKKNTENKINRKYRLYMTIDNSLEIGNLETAVFTLDEWESAFASVKLNVTGDFSEKKIFLYDDCFRTSTLADGTLEITDYYKYSPGSNNELYQNPLCTSDVVIPSTIDGVNVTKIGYYSFNSCQLTSIKISNHITEIGNMAFNNNQLTSVVIPNSVTIIGASAFRDNQLTSVVLPNTLRTIDSFAFLGNQLTSVVIPDSVISIGFAAFNDNKLSSSNAFVYARTDNNNDRIAEIDNTKIVSYGGLDKDIIIPAGVTELDNYSFSNNSLTSVVLPNTLRTIGSSAFEYNNLTSILIPNDVSQVGWYAFGNNFLTEIVLESRNLYISNQAFATHGASYSGNNMITKVINNGGREIDWDSVFGLESSDGNSTFATGTYKFYYNGNQTIEITAS